MSATSQQWATDGANIYTTNTGNVGIGTSNPSHKLEIRGNSESLLTLLQLSNLPTGSLAMGKGAAISLGYPNGQYSTKVATVYEQNNPNFLNPALAFYTMNNTYLPGSEVERMRISSIGNVGIGTTAPTQLLHINTTAVNGSFLKLSTNATNKDIANYYSDGTNEWYAGMLGLSGGGAGNYVIANSSASVKLTILQNGYIGMGTITGINRRLNIKGTTGATNSEIGILTSVVAI